MDYHSNISLGDLFAGKNLDSRLRGHLSKVYGSLCYTLCLAAVGTALGGSWIFSLLGMVCLLYVFATKNQEKADLGRLIALGGFGFCEGVGISSLVYTVAIRIDPRLILTAFLATSAIFVCFSLAALWAPKNSYLYLGGFLSGTLLILLILGLVNLFVRSESIFNLELGVGLLVMMGYILYDTQVIILRYENGDRDYLSHSVNLFIDFVGIFVRILIILAKNSEKKKKDN